ncbi:bifunctional riboflavin kinase/FAD synthetase [Nostoc sp. FACHB-110]|uniref:bifunctional riboflavin kinase/FAD synthetase n=1 Tax=Nostoc sp. FACHB-110 TaxID=2692834 RepID=UPI0016846BA9|nr:bifunctional riboflavin kinase/FAD synthetase [Nostoc sp. FACHB-110]MBD2439748.1 bifunctional riboflavin kinase/FAD synthetase [Nostoc sp. FACHB-110]
MLNLSQNGCSVWIAASTTSVLTPTTVALGKFDGVHLGHQKVIQPILHSAISKAEESQRWQNGEIPADFSPSLVTPQTQSQERTYSTVVTFHPHPQEFFTGKPRTWLTPLDEKVQQLRSLGVEQLVLLPFDKELSALSPEEFVDKILVQTLKCQRISVGQDFCFGKQRQGTAKDLQLFAAKYNIPVTIVPLQIHADRPTLEAPISTSLIRQSLESGDIKSANLCLGRPYTLTGVVIQGQQLGRTIGFPTANLQIPSDKFLPRQGVYAVRVNILSDTPETTTPPILGVMNIGNRPTLNGAESSVEVHLFDWSGDLYGQTLAVQLIEFLRPEQKFPSLEALKTQIQQDCVIAQKVLRESC